MFITVVDPHAMSAHACLKGDCLLAVNDEYLTSVPSTFVSDRPQLTRFLQP